MSFIAVYILQTTKKSTERRSTTWISYHSTKAEVSNAWELRMHSLAALRLHYSIKGLETCCHRGQGGDGGTGLGVPCYIYSSGLWLGKTVGLEHLVLGIWSCLAGLWKLASMQAQKCSRTPLICFYGPEIYWHNLGDPESEEHIIHFGQWNMFQALWLNSHDTQGERWFCLKVHSRISIGVGGELSKCKISSHTMN